MELPFRLGGESSRVAALRVVRFNGQEGDFNDYKTVMGFVPQEIGCMDQFGCWAVWGSQAFIPFSFQDISTHSQLHRRCQWIALGQTVDRRLSPWGHQIRPQFGAIYPKTIGIQ